MSHTRQLCDVRMFVVASYVTAGGRMKLCTYLDTLQQRALYADTDSVIYIRSSDGAAMVQTGDCLGDMTSELKPCEYIAEYISADPRSMRT